MQIIRISCQSISAFNYFLGLAHAGVDSIKIQGRIKKFDYVSTDMDTWNPRDNSLGLKS